MSNRRSGARQVVLESAIAEFARKGYAGTSIQDILGATGLSKPTLYYYFESKAGLFRAILDFAYEESFRMMREGTRGKKSCEERLVEIASALFRFAERHRSLLRLVFATVFAAPEEIPPKCIDPTKRRRNFEFVLQIVSEGQKKGELDAHFDPLDLTHGILGAISHRARMHLIQPQGRLDRASAERIATLFLNGARPKHHVTPVALARI
jgi:AcrR family transcriptional regulator